MRLAVLAAVLLFILRTVQTLVKDMTRTTVQDEGSHDTGAVAGLDDGRTYHRLIAGDLHLADIHLHAKREHAVDLVDRLLFDEEVSLLPVRLCSGKGSTTSYHK